MLLVEIDKKVDVITQVTTRSQDIKLISESMKRTFKWNDYMLDKNTQVRIIAQVVNRQARTGSTKP